MGELTSRTLGNGGAACRVYDVEERFVGRVQCFRSGSVVSEHVAPYESIVFNDVQLAILLMCQFEIISLGLYAVDQGQGQTEGAEAFFQRDGVSYHERAYTLSPIARTSRNAGLIVSFCLGRMFFNVHAI